MKKYLLMTGLACFLLACGGGSEKNEASNTTAKPKSMIKKDEGKGVGEIKSVTLNDPLNEEMASHGEAIYQLKCAACHKLSDKRVVGPGWAGVTSKRKPEWIMNMITNVDMMLEQDPTAQKLLEECLTRMPNQNVSTEDARDILEFMLKNDAERSAK
jgi:cytochrome c